VLNYKYNKAQVKQGVYMEQMSKLDELILYGIRELSPREKEEVLSYIQFMKIKEREDVIEYINMRAKEAIDSKKRGKVFSSLKELQKEYA
jgi:acetate kinase